MVIKLEKNIMVGSGNVEVIYNDMRLYADKITVWVDNEIALAQGNVKLIRDDITFYGQEVSYYFKENKGKIIEPSFDKYGPWFGKGLEAEEYEKAKYLIKESYITTCDLSEPHYRFQAKSVKVYLKDRFEAKNVIFYVKNTPIFYLPSLKQSLKERKAPFLFVPGKSDDWGWYFLTAYKYTLNENNKGRLKLDYREKKGFAHGVDHMYKTNFGEGLIKHYYMNEKNSSFSDNDRFRVSLRHSWQPDAYTSLYAEYNKMSDIDFLKDYLYEQEYEKESQPETYLYLIRRFPYATFNLNVKKRANHFFSEVEKLPEAGIDVNDIRIKNSNFYYSSSTYFSNLTNKIADSDTDDDVWRFDFYNEISHAQKYLGFLNFSPYIGVRETFFSKNINGDEYSMRGSFYTGFDASTKIYKTIYPESGKFLFSPAQIVRHIVTPIIRYDYIADPTISNTKLMQFDEIDAIERKSRATIALENLWQVKSEASEAKRDLLRFNIAADYDFKINGGSRWQEAILESEYLPLDWLRFKSEVRYDLYPGHFNTATIDAIINKEKWQLGLGHRYEQDTSSQLTAEARYKMNEKWAFRAYQRYEFEDSSPERWEFTVYRDLHCWQAEFSFINNRLDGDKAIFIIFTLKAFPEIPFRFSQSYNQPGS